MKLASKKLDEIIHFFDNINPYDSNNTGLFNGISGIAIFLFHYSKIYKNGDYEEKAMSFLESVATRINLDEYHTFCSGISGFCWTIDHLLRNQFLHEENIELIEPFDNYLCNAVLTDLSYGNNDFLHGSIGTAIYLLKRIENTTVKNTISGVINLLVQQKITHTTGSYWKFPEDFETDKKIENISLSHGLSSICIFLTKAYNSGIKHPQIEELLKSNIHYLLSQEIKDPDRMSMFPTFSLNEENPELRKWSRLGWCYGDLGVGLAMWHYSQIFKDKTMESKAIEIFLFASQRKNLQKNGICDAGLCHGTAGLALIFRRIYLNTKMEIFKSTAEYWLEQTILMSKYPDGYAGYKASDGKPYMELLEGLAGIGLVLLSFITNTDPIWDECLLLS